MRIRASVLLISIFLLASCKVSKTSSQDSTSREDKRISIIFETDMGNDIDDALALDMLYKYIEAGKINLLAISTNKGGEYSAGYLDVMNTWYGYPNIPIGVIERGASVLDDKPVFAQAACELKIDGKPAFKRTVKNYKDFPKSVPLYRKILASQPDSSVVIISVGFCTNLAQLLDTKGDEYSPLSGKELVAKKVKYVSTMMGRFVNEHPEYNVRCDIPSAQRFIQEWPTDMVVSPHELGYKIHYPGSSIENDFKWKDPNPLVVGYENYAKMPYDRPTWDLTSVLCVVENEEEFFNSSGKGTIFIDNKGTTRFTPSPEGKHSYLKATKEQGDMIKNYFVDMITQVPSKYQNKK